MIGNGQRNRRMSVQRASEVSDGQGGLTTSWATIWTGLVKANPVAGKEALVAGTLRDVQPWRIEMLTCDVTTADRMVADWLPAGFVIDVQSVADLDGRGRSLVVFGEAKRGNG